MRLVMLPFLILLTAPSRSFASIDSLIPYPAKATLGEGFVPKDAQIVTTIDKSCTDLGSEGYTLSCTPNECRVIATTGTGIFYGKLTLDQLRATGRVPCCEIRDVPAMRMRGVMFDLARREITRAISMIDEHIARENTLRKELNSNWDRWRYADDPSKASGGQNLLGYFIDSDFYMKHISAQLKIAGDKLDKGEQVDWDSILKRP